MKTLITIIGMLLTFNLMAHDHVEHHEHYDHTHEHEELTHECNQKVRVITKWKTKVVYRDRIVEKEVPKVVYKDRIVYKNRPVSKPKVVYRDRIVYKEKPVIKYKTRTIVKKRNYYNEPRKNSISLMGMANRTKLEIDEEFDEFDVRRDHELDFGLMYQRDFSKALRFSIGGNLDGGGFLGLGYNF